MTRTDALKMAAENMLEQFRPLVETHPEFNVITLTLRIRPDNTIHTVQLAPSYETHPHAHPSIEKFNW